MVGVCLGLSGLGLVFWGGWKVGWRRSEECIVIKHFKCSISLFKSNSLWLNSIAFQVRSDDPKSLHSNMIERGTQSAFCV